MTILMTIFDIIVVIYTSVKIAQDLNNLTSRLTVIFSLDGNIRFGAAAIPLYLSRGFMLFYNISAAYIVFKRVQQIQRSLPDGSDGNSTVTDPFSDHEDLVRNGKKNPSGLPEPEDFSRHRNSKQEPYYRTNSDASTFVEPARQQNPPANNVETEIRPTTVPQRLFRKNTSSPAPGRKMRPNSFRNDENHRESYREDDPGESSTSFGESKVTFGKSETKYQERDSDVFRAIPYIDDEASNGRSPRVNQISSSSTPPPPLPPPFRGYDATPPIRGYDNRALQNDEDPRPSSVAGARESVLSAGKKSLKLPTGAFTYLTPQTPVLSDDDSQSESSRRGSVVAPPSQRTSAPSANPTRNSTGNKTTLHEEIEPDYD
jgi:hypothetical protein